MADLLNLTEILEKNKDKNFVQRILHPENYPNLPMPEYGKGGFGTHLMSSGEYSGKGIVYPEIIQDSKTGELRRLGRREAMDYAIRSGEYITFDTLEDAEWFGKNYKKYWGGGVEDNQESFENYRKFQGMP